MWKTLKSLSWFGTVLVLNLWFTPNDYIWIWTLLAIVLFPVLFVLYLTAAGHNGRKRDSARALRDSLLSRFLLKLIRFPCTISSHYGKLHTALVNNKKCFYVHVCNICIVKYWHWLCAEKDACTDLHVMGVFFFRASVGVFPLAFNEQNNKK